MRSVGTSKAPLNNARPSPSLLHFPRARGQTPSDLGEPLPQPGALAPTDDVYLKLAHGHTRSMSDPGSSSEAIYSQNLILFSFVSPEKAVTSLDV